MWNGLFVVQTGVSLPRSMRLQIHYEWCDASYSRVFFEDSEFDRAFVAVGSFGAEIHSSLCRLQPLSFGSVASC